MPRIRFTATPKLPRDLAHLAYKSGQVHDLPSDQAERWLRRGVAERLPDAPLSADPAAAGPAQAEQSASAVDIPEGWRDLHHMSRTALAKRLTTDPVPDLAAADAVIAAEVARRAAT